MDALPEQLKFLNALQKLSLSAISLRSDMEKLFSFLIENGVRRNHYQVPMPVPKKNMLFPLALTEDQIADELEHLVGWEIVHYFSREQQSRPGIAIEKIFIFKTFESAVEFMYSVSKYVVEMQHHPEWENLWTSVRVRLSTWDVGHKVSNLDIVMAKYMDQKFLEY